jgi:hypothetical protein
MAVVKHNFVVVRKKSDNTLRICFNGRDPFIGTKKDAEALIAHLNLMNGGNTYLLYTLEKYPKPATKVSKTPKE